MSVIAKEIIPVEIQEEMKGSYLDYAMSVITARALPEVRDGLKPVQRRILYGMYEDGLLPERPHKKSARIVGDVMGKYHPHGDAAIYETIVRMVQDFNARYPLIDGQGNFGSIDGDEAAAMRYTEIRMSPLALEMLADIDKDTIDFRPNYDESLREPSILPAKLPNLLVNGSAGIAVGMATNIPPHNLSEVIDGIIMTIENPEVTIEELAQVIQGPDFPTGGLILGTQGIREAYETGKGQIIMQAKAVIEEIEGGKRAIVITELPYQVNRAKLIQQIAQLYREKKFPWISDVYDASDRTGMRVVIELRREANPHAVLKALYKHTPMRTSFGIIMLALVDGQPRILNLKEIINYYIQHRQEVVTRRTRFELAKAKARAHIVEGLRIALRKLNLVIKIIRESRTAEIARSGLMENLKLTQEQAQAILDMRLQQLTGLEQEKLEKEYKDLIKQIAYLEDVLADPRKILYIIKEELEKLKAKYGDERRTKIRKQEAEEITEEELVAEEEMVITITRDGYIKRLPLDTYRTQERGGKGMIALTPKEQDWVEHLFVASTQDYILFFTNRGKVYRLKAYEIPIGSRQARGTAVINLIEIEPGEIVTAVLSAKSLAQPGYLFMATKNGIVKKTALSDFQTTRRGGLTAIGLSEGDELKWVQRTFGDQDILLVTKGGLAIRFSESQVRPMGRPAAGVIGIRLRRGDLVIGMDVVKEGYDLLVISENGYGKRTAISEYPKKGRGGLGIITAKTTPKTGNLVAMKMVKSDDEIMIITANGVLIRQKVEKISQMGRNAQGVRLIRLAKEDKVTAVARVVEGEST